MENLHYLHGRHNYHGRALPLLGIFYRKAQLQQPCIRSQRSLHHSLGDVRRSYLRRISELYLCHSRFSARVSHSKAVLKNLPNKAASITPNPRSRSGGLSCPVNLAKLYFIYHWYHYRRMSCRIKENMCNILLNFFFQYLHLWVCRNRFIRLLP